MISAGLTGATESGLLQSLYVSHASSRLYLLPMGVKGRALLWTSMLTRTLPNGVTHFERWFHGHFVPALISK